MKKNLMALICFACVNASNAQLSVNSNGNAGIGCAPMSSTKLYVQNNQGYGAGILSDHGSGLSITTYGQNNYSTQYGINLYQALQNDGNQPTYGIQVLQLGTSLATLTGIRCLTTIQQNVNSYGIIGGLTNGGITGNAVGIYGSSTSNTPIEYPGVYAGYFNGDVRVTGGIYGNLFTPLTFNSSLSLETQLLSDSNDNFNVTNKLSKVQAIKVALLNDAESSEKKWETPIGMSEEDIMNSLDTAHPTVTNSTVNTRYELVADQLKEIYPELVFEDNEGNISINYIEMVPLLLQYINEINCRLQKLEGGNQKAKRISGETDENFFESSISNFQETKSTLNQNHPNPFSENTYINITLDNNVQSAFLNIYDLNGKQIKQVEIHERGNFDIDIQATDLYPGIFIYSLIIDGKRIGAKRMIVL